MKVEEWQKGITAWENIKKQATIDIEQAELYIHAINKKIAEVKKLEVK